MPDDPTTPGEGRSEPPRAGAEERRMLVHNLRNTVYAIVLQAEAADQSVKAGQTEATLRAIDRIKTAARETAEALDALLEDVREEK